MGELEGVMDGAEVGDVGFIVGSAVGDDDGGVDGGIELGLVEGPLQKGHFNAASGSTHALGHNSPELQNWHALQISPLAHTGRNGRGMGSKD